MKAQEVVNAALERGWQERRSPARRDAERRYREAQSRLKVLLEPGREFWLILDHQVAEHIQLMTVCRQAIRNALGA